MLHSPAPIDHSQKNLFGGGIIIHTTIKSSSSANIANTGATRAKIIYVTETSSTTKISVALGGIGPTPPAP